MKDLSSSLVVGIILLPLTLLGCGRDEQPAEPAAGPPAVTLTAQQVATVEERTIHPAFELIGQTTAVQSARIKPQVSARIVANLFTGGEEVQEGQLLVELDPSDYRAALTAAQAEVKSTTAAYKQASANWARAQELITDGFISKLDYDRAEAEIQATEARLAQARAALERAELDLDRTRILAPFTGRISPPGYAVGDLVRPLSTKPLFELLQLDPIYVDVAVEQGNYNRFTLLRQKLQARGVTIPHLEVSIVLAGGEPYPYPGTFQSWDPSAKAAPGMIVGRSLFPNPDQILLPGQSVTVRGRAIEPVEGVFVPQRAVLQDQQGHYVIVVTPEDTVARRNIEVGIRDGADWSVRSGLEPGDRVVIQGAQRLVPGTRVSISGDS